MSTSGELGFEVQRDSFFQPEAIQGRTDAEATLFEPETPESEATEDVIEPAETIERT
jgi:hypothetical protein